VVHHVRKSIGHREIGSAFRGSSALHAVGDSYLLLTRPAANLAAAAVELRFQFRYAASQPSRLLQLDPHTLWFSAAGLAPGKAAVRKKVEQQDVTQALAGLGEQARYNQLRQQVMDLTACSKRTAQLAIAAACQQGLLVQADGQYRLRFESCDFASGSRRRNPCPAGSGARGWSDGSVDQTCNSV
jgi:hypothetical protein